MSFDINTNLCIFCNDKSDCAVQELHNHLKTPLISMRTTLKLLIFQAQLSKHTHNQFNMIQTMDIYSRYAWILIYLYFHNIRLGSLICEIEKNNYLNLFSSPKQGDDLYVRLAAPQQLQPKPDADALTFGKNFTDHMLKVFWHKSLGGWQKPEITPMENLVIHPAAKVLHYAIEVIVTGLQFRFAIINM